jgi:type II restriction enzyme
MDTLIGKNKCENPMKKGRAIVETELDGSYVLTETNIEVSNKVKPFSEFINDFKKLIGK